MKKLLFLLLFLVACEKQSTVQTQEYRCAGKVTWSVCSKIDYCTGICQTDNETVWVNCRELVDKLGDTCKTQRHLYQGCK